MEDKYKDKNQYELIIADLRTEIDNLINILKETLEREQEGNKTTVEAMQSIVESYNKKERNIIITVIIVIGILLALVYVL